MKIRKGILKTVVVVVLVLVLVPVGLVLLQKGFARVVTPKPALSQPVPSAEPRLK